MKSIIYSILCSVLTIFLFTGCGPSVDYTGLDFMGMEMRGSSEDFVQKLTESGKFELISDDGYAAKLYGDYYGYRAEVQVPLEYSCVKYIKVNMEGGDMMVNVFAYLHQQLLSEYGGSLGLSVYKNNSMSDRWETELGSVDIIYLAPTSLSRGISYVHVEYDSKGDPTIEYEKVTSY